MTGDDGAMRSGDKPFALVIGAGPAGLMAAEELARVGNDVLVADQMPSVGRKLLMAGKSGLNLTKSEEMAAFLSHFSGSCDALHRAVSAFGPDAVEAFANDLGQDTFRGSTGRVYPRVMKASPLLRAWLARLDGLGVQMRTRWRWTGWEDGACAFETPDGRLRVPSDATVMALGGASWRRLGSDGDWAGVLAEEGIPLAPFKPANVGFRIAWSGHMKQWFGTAVKGTRLNAGPLESRGEWIVSERGIEGGGIYEVSAAVRDGAALFVDFAPDLSRATLADRLARTGRKASTAQRLRKVGVSDIGRALLNEWARPLPASPHDVAARIKQTEIPHIGPRPMNEAISVAGGVRNDALDRHLMLRSRPGVFCAGEMLDWEAPTGGYLITGCLATGRMAGRAAAEWLATKHGA